ncbi:MAG: GLPGLI family protein [Bacteroides sp.]|nr:GLPGLI family protein [Bacteroides sp.]
MNKLLILTAICIVAIAATAQEKADILVSYESVSPTPRGKTDMLKMSLLVNATEAKYFNDISLWVDSLKSTPEGGKKYMEIIKKACMTVEPDGSVTFDLTKGPSKKTHTYVFTNLTDGELTFYGRFGEDQGYYNEPFDEMKWTIAEDSTATVLGYDCILAESDYHGRHWRAWFTPEIPVSFGPWKLRGLPGLILKAETDGNFSFTATGLEKTDRTITPMYFKDDYTKVDRLKALADAEYYHNNKESILKAQGHDIQVYYRDDDGNKIEVPKYDGLKHSFEPDYKIKK